MADRLVISDKEKNAVLKLDGSQRYSYFIKRVADWEVAWGLRQDDGWALFADDDGNLGFPVWPAQEYAEACAIADWTDCVPEQIPLDDLLNKLRTVLQEDHMGFAVFATPSAKGVLVVPDQLRRDLELEYQKYE